MYTSSTLQQDADGNSYIKSENPGSYIGKKVFIVGINTDNQPVNYLTAITSISKEKV